jgi:hypothetical protein
MLFYMGIFHHQLVPEARGNITPALAILPHVR